MSLSEFALKLQGYKLKNCFNPYWMIDSEIDKKNAPILRVQNLESYLEWMLRSQPKAMWVGEALGYRGGKCSGLPFTDTTLLERLYGCKLSIPTKIPIKETTAQIIHSALITLNTTPILWNIFPFHPHQPGNIRSNRTPTANELGIGYTIFKQLIALFDDLSIVAIGRKAEMILNKHSIECTYIRHPSRGGSKIFKEQIQPQPPLASRSLIVCGS